MRSVVIDKLRPMNGVTWINDEEKPLARSRKDN